MQKNAFHEIWTLLSRKVLREIRIFDNCFGVTFVRFGINVKTVLMLRIAIRFHFFERRTDFGLHFIKQSSAESIT